MWASVSMTLQNITNTRFFPFLRFLVSLLDRNLNNLNRKDIFVLEATQCVAQPWTWPQRALQNSWISSKKSMRKKSKVRIHEKFYEKLAKLHVFAMSSWSVWFPIACREQEWVQIRKLWELGLNKHHSQGWMEVQGPILALRGAHPLMAPLYLHLSGEGGILRKSLPFWMMRSDRRKDIPASDLPG